MVGACDEPTGNDVMSAPIGETERSPLAILEPSSLTIEVLRTTSVHPITEAPMSPVSMPWDQVEEIPAPVVSEAEVQGDAGIVEAPQRQELSGTDHALDAGIASDSSTSATSSFTSSSGLSWEDILTAVAAMQLDPALAQPQSTAEGEDVTSIVGRAGSTSTSTSPADPSETAWLSLAPPPSESLVTLASDSPSLSAPMPWEQIEVEDVAIPRQDPEPEFGTVSTDVVETAQDATVVLPAEEDEPASVPAMALLTDEAVVDSAIRIETPSTPELRILALDAPIELHQHSIPIHIPATAVEPVEEPIFASVFEPELPAEARRDSPGERLLRLAGDDASATLEQEQPGPVSAEPLMAVVVAPLSDMPTPSMAQAAAQHGPAPLAEPVEVIASEPLALVPTAVVQMTIPEPTVLATVPETSAPSPASPLSADQTVLQAATNPDIVSSEADDVAPLSNAETSPLLAQDDARMPEAIVHDADALPLSEEAVPEGEVSVVSEISTAEPFLPLEPAVPDGERADEPDLPFNESSRATEMAERAERLDVPVEPPAVQPPATASVSMASPEATAEAGPRILWDDSVSQPMPSPSTGNMLTRWLSKPKDVAPAEASQATMLPQESLSLFDPSMEQRSEMNALPADPLVEQSDEAMPLPVDQPARGQKLSMPAAGRAWRHIGRTVASFIGAGVSTTQSLVVFLVALAGAALMLVAGTVGTLALTWMALEQQPNSAYRTMTSVPQHTLQDSQKNGYFILLGFGALPAQDAMQVGIDRRAEDTDRALASGLFIERGEGLRPPAGRAA